MRVGGEERECMMGIRSIFVYFCEMEMILFLLCLFLHGVLQEAKYLPQSSCLFN